MPEDNNVVLAPACSRLTYALQSQPLDCGTGASVQSSSTGLSRTPSDSG